MKHFGGFEIALNQRDTVGEVPSSTTDRSIEDDRRSVKEAKFSIERRNRRLDDPWRSAVTSVRAVRPNRDGVEMRHRRNALSSRSKRRNPHRPDCLIAALRASPTGAPARRSLANSKCRSTARLPVLPTARGFARGASNRAAELVERARAGLWRCGRVASDFGARARETRSEPDWTTLHGRLFG